MRTSRHRVSGDDAVGYYHCLSRVVNRDFILGDEEKERLVELMRAYESFCGVRVVTYAMMSNHFHILVEVPRRPEAAALPTDAQLVSLVRRAKGSYGSGTLKQDLERLRAQGAHEAAEALRERFLSRMWDVSWFMRLIKQRFTQWYNKRKERTGTLWEDRFKSVLVEGAGRALSAMAIYIDLNPVRASMVDDPGQYRWCGYAAAMAGQKAAREGCAVVVAAVRGLAVVAQRVMAEYRLALYGRAADRGQAENGGPLRRGVSAERIAEVIEKKGKLAPWEAMRCRVRYFSDGVVLGSRGFVERFFSENRGKFGPRRESGARKMRHVEFPDLFTVRDLQKTPIG